MKTEQKDKLAEIYSRSTDRASVVAEICDEILDRTGRLLGEVRKIARNKYINPIN